MGFTNTTVRNVFLNDQRSRPVSLFTLGAKGATPGSCEGGLGRGLTLGSQLLPLHLSRGIVRTLPSLTGRSASSSLHLPPRHAISVKTPRGPGGRMPLYCQVDRPAYITDERSKLGEERERGGRR